MCRTKNNSCVERLRSLGEEWDNFSFVLFDSSEPLNNSKYVLYSNQYQRDESD